MSMSILEYDHWCDAMKNSNSVIEEITTHRRENLKWFCDELKEIFGVCGEVSEVATAKDGTIIDVTFKDDDFRVNMEAFNKVYCPMRVFYDNLSGHLKVRVYPNVRKAGEQNKTG